MVSYILRLFFRYDPVPAPIDQSDNIRWKRSHRHSPTRIHDLPDICPCYKTPVHDIPLFFVFSAHPACPRCKACNMLHFPCCHKHLEFFYWNLMKLQYFCRTQWFFSRFSTSDRKKMDLHIRSLLFIIRLHLSLSRVYTRMLNLSFFMLLYCYCVSKPHHFDTVLYLINVVTKLLYPNCTQNSI